MPADVERTLEPPDAVAIADAYGLGSVRSRPVVAARGELGRIWRLETAGGTWAVKELLRPDAATAEDDAQADVAFQEAALAAGVPMPRPVVGRDGNVLTNVGSGDAIRLVRVYTWIDLASRAAVVPTDAAAAILGRLHGLALADDRPLDSWYLDSIPDERWPELVEAARSGGASWAPALQALIPILMETAPVGLAARHSASGPTITCHLDYNPENVLLDVAGRPIVVDWENSGPAAAEQELASAVAEFVRDPAETAGFLAAYAATGGPAMLVDRTSFAMTLVVQARLVESYTRRALDATAPSEDRARAAHWVEDIAANAFTIERIDAWLAASSERGRGGRAGVT